MDEIQEYRKAKFKEKKQNLSFFVFLYIRLRKKCVNPILFANDVERMEAIRKDMKEGSTQVMSSIESALLNDLRIEELTGKPTSENLDAQITFSKMMMRYTKLIQQILQSNVELLAYIFMLIETVRSPGILTLVYPFSVFGYALMEETRPRRYFWYLLMLYTQLCLIVQFVLSLRFWAVFFPHYQVNLQKECQQYYIGLEIVQGADIVQLVTVFTPKILILWASVSFVHNEVILKLHEKKEQDQEPIHEAYIRFVSGQFGTKIDKVTQEEEMYVETEKSSIRHDLNKIVFNSNLRRSIDDFGVDYSRDAKVNTLLTIDREEIHKYLDDFRPFKSQQDIYEDTGSQTDDADKADRAIQQRRRLRTMHDLRKKLSDVFVRNAYMQKLYPSLKIQKPGIDFYQHMLAVQVLMCLYILIWYPNMAAEEETIIK